MMSPRTRPRSSSRSARVVLIDILPPFMARDRWRFLSLSRRGYKQRARARGRGALRESPAERLITVRCGSQTGKTWPSCDECSETGIYSLSLMPGCRPERQRSIAFAHDPTSVPGSKMAMMAPSGGPLKMAVYRGKAVGSADPRSLRVAMDSSAYEQRPQVAERGAATERQPDERPAAASTSRGYPGRPGSAKCVRR